MVNRNTCGRIKKSMLLVAVMICTALTGCSFHRGSSVDAGVSSASASTQGNPPGVVNYVWEEPMVNVIEVPPGLDPEGIYYRPAHKEVVQVRQGKWRYYGEGN